MPQVVAKLNNDDISLQIVDGLCFVPWGHLRYIINKCKEDPEKAITNFDKQLPVVQGDLAQYAVESVGEPIRISEYELSKVYPADFKSSLSTIEEIEQQLRD